MKNYFFIFFVSFLFFSCSTKNFSHINIEENQKVDLEKISVSEINILPNDRFLVSINFKNTKKNPISGILKYKVHPLVQIKKVYFNDLESKIYDAKYNIKKSGLITIYVSFLTKGEGTVYIELYYPDYKNLGKN